MVKIVGPMVAAIVLVAAADPAFADPGSQQIETAAPAGTVCKFVVAPTPGAKPQEMCLTPQQWDIKKKADAKDSTRIVCRYEQASGTRFKTHKICMSAAEWENQRQLQRQGIDAIQRTTCVGRGGC